MIPKDYMYTFIGIGIMSLGIFGGTGLYNYFTTNPIEEFNGLVPNEYYCIEWDGWIDRDNMIFNCYDFINQTQKCYWSVLNNQNLRIFHLEGFDYQPEYSEYNCSRYIRTIKGIR